MNVPAISVIIPSYNRGSMLLEAVESCLAQDGVDIEVIVVDDGSTDGLIETLLSKQPKIRLFRQVRSGACAARNRGLEEARGQYIKFIDSDDKLAPNILAKQVASLETSDADVVYGDFEMFGNFDDPRTGGKPVRLTGILDDPVDALLDDWWCAPFCYLYKRDAISNLSWSVDLECLQDFDFILKFAMQGKKFLYYPGVVGYYRIHEGQITNKTAYQYAVNRCRILERTLKDLKQRGDLTEKRKILIAHGYWTAARAFYRTDLEEFEETVLKVNQLNRHFWPRFWAPWPVCILTGLLGIKKAENLLAIRRKLKSKLKALFSRYKP